MMDSSAYIESITDATNGVEQAVVKVQSITSTSSSPLLYSFVLG